MRKHRVFCEFILLGHLPPCSYGLRRIKGKLRNREKNNKSTMRKRLKFTQVNEAGGKSTDPDEIEKEREKEKEDFIF